MKNKILFCLIALFTLLAACTTTRSPWQLVWEDDFNGNQIDWNTWSKIPRGLSDWDNYMSDHDSLFAINNGNVHLYGRVNYACPNDTAPFITGGIYTKDKRGFENGRLEIKAKFEDAQGAWPAFWLLPFDTQRGGWPDGGEIDIMERLNGDTLAYQTVHSGYTYRLKIKDPPQGATGPINKDDYNIFAVELYKDSLSFYINDKHTFTYPRIETSQPGQFPFDQPFYLLLDMQLGGSWVGKVYREDLPVKMSIDWVRFFQKKE